MSVDCGAQNILKKNQKNNNFHAKSYMRRFYHSHSVMKKEKSFYRTLSQYCSVHL